MTTPLSPWISLLRGRLLFVPTKILPPEIVGPPKTDFEPRGTDHLMFFSIPGRLCHSVGTSVSRRLTRLRCTVPPQSGQARGAAGRGEGFPGAGRCQAGTTRTSAKKQPVAARART